MLASAVAMNAGVHRLARGASEMGDELPGQLLLQIGELLGQTKRLVADVADIKQQQALNAQTANKDRADIKAEIAHLSGRVSAVETGQIALQAEQIEMKEITDKVTSWKHMGTGAAAVIAFFAGLGGWVLSRFWDRLFGP